MSEEQHITIREAANLLGVSRQAVYLRVASGNIPTKTLCGLKVVERAEIERIIAERDSEVETDFEIAEALAKLLGK
jgi:excisionase family DNA binding protein